MSVDKSKLIFLSTESLLKRDETLCGSQALTLPAHGLTVSHTVNHNLGYIPFFEVSVDFDNDGVIWAGEKIDTYAESSLSGVEPTSPALKYWITTTTLTITLDNTTTPTATGTRTVYWVIYLDYGDV